jgi:hypothetical protein
MMQEIAAKAGNFCGVCPLNRAAENLCPAYITTLQAEPAGLFEPVFFLPWSDTHEKVDKKSSHRTKRDKELHFVCIKEETNTWQLRKK